MVNLLAEMSCSQRRTAFKQPIVRPCAAWAYFEVAFRAVSRPIICGARSTKPVTLADVAQWQLPTPSGHPPRQLIDVTRA